MELLPLLQEARSGDTTIRNNAEARLRTVAETNLEMYFVKLANVAVEPSTQVEYRQLACILIKNELYLGLSTVADNKKIERWKMLSAGCRDDVKSKLVNTIGCRIPEVVTQAATAVAKIAKIELPAWNSLLPGIFKVLSEASTPPEIKYAFIQTLGYICEAITDDRVFTEEEKKTMVMVMITFMSPSQPVPLQQVASSSLIHVLDFAGECFEDTNIDQRNKIMSAICTSTTVSDLKTRMNGFDCISRVGLLYYSHLEAYMLELFKLTTATADSSENNLAIRAFEFWLCIAETELAIADGELALKSAHYIKGAIPSLVPLVARCMRRVEDEPDEDTYTQAMAATTCLSLVAQVAGDECFDKIRPLIEAAVADGDWKARDFASLAIGAIVNGPKSVVFLEWLRSVYPMMLARLVQSDPKTPQEPQATVRESLAYSLGKFFGYHPELITNLDFVLESMRQALKDSSPRVASHSATAIHHLSYKLNAVKQHDALAPKLPALLQDLVVASMREDRHESELVDSCFTAVSELVKNTSNAHAVVVANFCEAALGLLGKQLTPPPAPLSEDDAIERQTLQQSYTGVVHSCMISLDSEIPRFKPLVDNVMNHMFGVLAIKSSIAHEEALYCIGVIANHSADFTPYMTVLAPHIVSGLKEHDNYQLCAVTVGVVSDISRCVPASEPFTVFWNEITKIVLANLVDSELSRDVKPNLLGLFSDLAFLFEGMFHAFLEPVCKILKQAGGIQPIPDDAEFSEFVLLMRLSILEAYSGIVHGFGTSERGTALYPFVNDIFAFLTSIAQYMGGLPEEERYEDMHFDLLRKTTGLMSDIASTLDRGQVLRSMNMTIDWVRALVTWTEQAEKQAIERSELPAESALGPLARGVLTGGVV